MIDELNLKIDKAKLATGSYFHDQVELTRERVSSYAVAAGLYVAAAIFLIAAILVGATAGFRWLEIQYGLFAAFGALGALLAILVVSLIALAVYRLRRPARRVVPLASRLRVAISSSPSTDEIVPAASLSSLPTRNAHSASATSSLVVASSLIGWALMRRRNSRRSA